MEINFWKTQHEILCDLIKKDNPDEVLTYDWLEFGEPEVIDPSDDIPRNTRILAKSTEASPYAGDKTFYYNRLDINVFHFDGMVEDEHKVIDPEYIVKTDDLFEKISDVFKIRISKNMIVSKPLPLVIMGQTVPVDIEFKDNNKTIIGTCVIYLRRA